MVPAKASMTIIIIIIACVIVIFDRDELFFSSSYIYSIFWQLLLFKVTSSAFKVCIYLSVLSLGIEPMNLGLLAQCSTSSDFWQIIKWVKKHIILTLEEDSKPYRGQSMVSTLSWPRLN